MYHISWRLLAIPLITLLMGAKPAPPPLVLEATIPLAHVSGRIDHWAADPTHRRLWVAELGNDTVDAIDLSSPPSTHRVKGLDEPQGVAYLAARDLIAVANGGDGSVRFFHAGDLSPAGRIALGSDADNARIDLHDGRLVVGYGSGALAIIDGPGLAKVADIVLPAHPEGFQIDAAARRAYINIPETREIVVMDLATGKQLARWPLDGLHANFPMALDAADQRVIVATREPPRLVALRMATGAIEAQLETCGDADDVFLDAKRRRFYVSCGEGAVDVFAAGLGAIGHIARIPTAPGARTSLFVPELDRLFVARRAGLLGGTAAILVFRPTP